MSDARFISYESIATVMRILNEKLLQNGKGLLVQAAVNDRNEIIDVDVVTVQVALANGFEPAKFVGKGKK